MASSLSLRLFTIGLLRVFSLFLIFLTSLGCHESKQGKIAPIPTKGILDLSDWTFEKDGVIKLNGEWEFYWNKLPYLDREDITKLTPEYAIVPSIWNDTVPGINPRKAFGFATYRLRISLAESAKSLTLQIQDFGTSANVYVNKKKVLQNGIVGKTAETTIPQYLPLYTEVFPENGELDIVIEVANFSHHKGGFWESIRLGNKEDIRSFSRTRTYTDFFLMGSILIMGLYHLGLFSLRKTDTSGLFFGLFCLAITGRLVTTGERILFQFYPNINWELGNKIEYLSLYTSIPLFYLFLMKIFSEDFSALFGKVTLWVHLVLWVMILLFPSLYYTQTLIPLEIYFIIVCLVSLSSLVLAIYRKRQGSLSSTIGSLFLIVTGINDVLHSQLIINTGYYAALGLFFFIFFQAYMLSARFSLAFRNVEELSENLKSTNLAYSRFVPMEFLQLLEKNSITDISLGDQVQKNMTILFADIRAFTKLSSKMSPKDNFNFINSYLKRMVPLIRKNHGFIDKYIGDAIMALFPGEIEDALRAGIEMRKELREMNYLRLSRGYDPIEVGIGVHVGSLMLGIIGESGRMEGTVISDAVNMASRVEGLSSIFKSPIVVTEAIIERLKDRQNFIYRYIGKAQVKGKEAEVKVYEIINGEEEQIFEKKLRTKEIFEEGVLALEMGKIAHSSYCFERVLELNSQDGTAFYYLNLNRVKDSK